ncbi:MAG TPA: HD domain-containing protein [Burkholderiaceae bacterium]|nr:HD domain-containing protein [Burkholderiaceae bacterium]
MTPEADAASPSQLGAIVAAIRAELRGPSSDRARVIAEVSSRLLAMPDDCLDHDRIDSLLETGQLCYFDGKTVEGLALVKAAADLAARAGNVPLQRKSLTYESAFHGDLGDVPTALESAAGAILISRRLNDTAAEATFWTNLGDLLLRIGDWRGALRTSERALELSADSVSALINAAEACLELGQIPKGLRYAQRCIGTSSQEVSLQRLTARSEGEVLVGRLLLEVDDVQRAAQHAAAARRAFEQSSSARAEPPVLALEGMCQAMSGHLREGLRQLRRAQALRTGDPGVDQGERRALRWLASVYRKLGDDAAARQVVAEQVEAMQESTRQHLLVAARLAPSSAFALVPELRTTAALERGSVLQRFASVAVSLEESSGEHGLRVRELAAGLALDYGCDDGEIEDVQRAAELHDIGKLVVPPSVLSKEDPLDAFEMSVFREHPLHGAALLAEAGIGERVVDGVRLHHESWDGNGYPFRLAGSSIPAVARIVGICEAFDEMIHSTARKREPWSVRRALEELLRQRGKRFDPRLVDLLIERVRRLQREFGGIDDALTAAADRSTLVIARRRLRELLEAPVQWASP